MDEAVNEAEGNEQTKILTEQDDSSQSNKIRITPSFMTKYERARIIGKEETDWKEPALCKSAKMRRFWWIWARKIWTRF